MDRDCVKPHGAPHETAGSRPGDVELWHCAHPLVWPRTVAVFLAMVLKQKASTLEQRLREWYYEAQHKRGKQRRELDVTTCFVPLMQWIVSLWTTTAIALALDATAALMTAFYRGYLKLDDKALALQQAMRELRSKPGYEHLRYWAPLWSAPRLDKYYKRPCHSEKGHTVRRYGPSQAG
jgi:hypothetical protein